MSDIDPGSISQTVLDEIDKLLATSEKDANSYTSDKIREALQKEFVNTSLEDRFREFFSVSEEDAELALNKGVFSEHALNNIKIVFQGRRDNIEKLGMPEVMYLSRERWRLANTRKIQEIVNSLSQSLSTLHDAIIKSNQIGSPNSSINQIQKAQIIAMLESTLAMLKAPAIDKEQTEGIVSELKNMFRRSAKKELEKTVSDAVGGAIDTGEQLVNELASQPIISNFDQLI